MMHSVFRVVFLLVFVNKVLTVPPIWPEEQDTTLLDRQKGSEIIVREETTNIDIRVHVGYMVNHNFKRLYTSHLSLDRLEVFFVEHELDPANREDCTRIAFRQDSFNSTVNLDPLYVKENQEYVDILGLYYDKQNFVVRGHLAAKADYGSELDQLCTFYYVNTAPQWQSFNNANWKSLEYRLRQRFVRPRYNTVIYSGNHGMLQLPDRSSRNQPVFLDNAKLIKVPLYFYKVVYDNLTGNATAFIGINNPFIRNLAEARPLVFCANQCSGNTAFDWLTWKPEIFRKGYSFCCNVDDFRRTVSRLPAFRTNGLLV